MVISQYNRIKISAISFICIVLVVMIHSHYDESKNYPFVLYTQLITGSRGLAIVAVPMFYAISGLLFFNGVTRSVDCLPKIKKRVRTLIIPYLSWNIVFVLWYVLLTFIPSLSSYANNNAIDQLDWNRPGETLIYLFVVPAGFHLWFLRDLILFTILSPILYLIINKTIWIGLFFVFFLSYFVPGLGLVYFMLGGIVVVKYNLERVEKALTPAVCTVAVIIYLGNAILSPKFTSLSIFWVQFVGISGIIVFWRAYDFVCKHTSISVRPYDIFSYTFFIYLFHEPAFNVIKKLSIKFFGTTTISLILLYFLNIVIMVLLAYAVGKAFRHTFPRLYSTLTGGR